MSEANNTDTIDRARVKLEAALQWLASEFPEWEFEVSKASTISKREVACWVARREGHHPQSELSAGKLHTRLTEYAARQASRFPQDN
ncbi:MAG: hypothetical protein ACRDUY_16245 [Nitriliruptorales bacterium]